MQAHHCCEQLCFSNTFILLAEDSKPLVKNRSSKKYYMSFSPQVPCAVCASFLTIWNFIYCLLKAQRFKGAAPLSWQEVFELGSRV